MTEYRFDEFLAAVQAAVQDAQQALRLRHEHAMRACFGEDSAWRVELAGKGGSSALVEIPLAQFRQKRPLRLAAFALEMGCDLRRRRDGSVVVRVIKGHPPGKCAHRVSIEFDGGEPMPGRVLVDGMPLRVLVPYSHIDTPESTCAEPQNS